MESSPSASPDLSCYLWIEYYVWLNSIYVILTRCHHIWKNHCSQNLDVQSSPYTKSVNEYHSFWIKTFHNILSQKSFSFYL